MMHGPEPQPAEGSIDANRLMRAIEAARAHVQSSSHDGAIWCQLLIYFQSNVSIKLHALEKTLAQALLKHQGIATVEEETLTDVLQNSSSVFEALDTGYEICFRLESHSQQRSTSLLLFEDPWHDAAIQCWATRQKSRLALAKPGQLQRLKQQQHPRPQKAPSPSTKPITDTNINSVVSFVDEAIERAYQDGASDIHFETDRQGVSVKYRLDGVIAPGLQFPDAQRAEEIVSRIKVLAQLDITERRRPQDGRIHWQSPISGDTIDLRVSIMPSIFGEDAVLRLLDKAQLRHRQSSISLDALGFTPAMARTIRDLAQRPHGMLLITGPTGSGKTTTVYAALSEVNDGLEKIITIEDPVEYELPGVLQIPVNEQKGLTFATGLRSILRHDPDKILVGEIRDSETAQIAVQSSLTGHLVFTTVHANSVFDVLGRFQHFGIEPFALASSLNGVVIQRLLRSACPHCLTWRAIHDEESAKLKSLALSAPQQLPLPKGCDACRHTGYKGRLVVAEAHQLDDALRDLVVAKATMTQLKQALYHHGDHRATRLLTQAIHLVAEGKTTLEEVTRVVGWT